jgi:hypothetical protein
VKIQSIFIAKSIIKIMFILNQELLSLSLLQLSSLVLLHQLLLVTLE